MLPLHPVREQDISSCSWSPAWCYFLWSTFMSALWGPSEYFWFSWPELLTEWGQSFLSFSLESANVLYQLEPSHLALFNGKRPNGVTLLPWQKCKCLKWDVTCAVMFGPSSPVRQQLFLDLTKTQGPTLRSCVVASLERWVPLYFNSAHLSDCSMGPRSYKYYPEFSCTG